jgi:hypothetical protein
LRSQLFGFVVQSQLIYELLLDCALHQAVTVMKQYLVEHGALVPTEPATRAKLIHYLDDPLTVGLEAYLNEWAEEIVQTVQAVTLQHNLNHSWLRMEELKRSLAWLWPNFRETTVMGHFVFSTTIENGILLTVTLGWNPGAQLPDIELTDTFIPGYIRRLEKLGYQYDVLSFPLKADERAPTPRRKRPRMDTSRKLKELVAYRAEHIQRNLVGIDKMQACADKNLALQTVKKYAPTLYDRWYDPTYEGDVH